MGGKNKKKARNGGASASEGADNDVTSPPQSPVPADESASSKGVESRKGADAPKKPDPATGIEGAVIEKPLRQSGNAKKTNGTSEKVRGDPQDLKANGAEDTSEEDAADGDPSIEQVRGQSTFTVS